MIKSILHDYSDVYITVEGIIRNVQEAGANLNNNDKEEVFKDCAPITYWKREKKNYIEIDNAKDTGVVMPMYKLKQQK